jgi:hypothetical protein
LFEYKSEILKISYKLLRASINDSEVDNLGKLINERALEGWELVTYSFMGGADNLGNGVLITFKKEK